jgi:hypothetical protein
LDFYPKNIDLEEIVEELDWKGNPVGGAGGNDGIHQSKT